MTAKIQNVPEIRKTNRVTVMSDISAPPRTKNWRVQIPDILLISEPPDIQKMFLGYHGDIWVLYDYDMWTTAIGGVHPLDHLPSQLAVIQLIELVRNFNERSNNGNNTTT